MISKVEQRMIIRDFLGNEWNIGCMGCDIANLSMQVPGGFIKRSRHFCVHQDPLIPLPGFLVIASLRHMRSIDEMNGAEYEDFSRLLRDAQRAIKDTVKVESLSIIQEEHSIHFHLWFFPWTGALIQQHGPPSLTSIRAIIAGYRREPIGAGEWQELEKTIENIRSRMDEMEGLHG
jgi:diadenosine tetraphosphate (Ap4A) HIT family hydrolase